MLLLRPRFLSRSPISSSLSAPRTAARRRARSSSTGLNTVVINAVLVACVRFGSVDLALRLFDEMRRPGGCDVDGVSEAAYHNGPGDSKKDR
ncbi:hypothetical protein ABZP36_036192 [Zizania latifolia]